MRIILRAFNDHGYHKDLVWADETQVRMTEGRVQDTLDGLVIVPADFPEMVKFALVIQGVTAGA